jgi:quercetin dioxygenase-like cupin family protein
MADPAVPQLLCNVAEVAAQPGEGALWRLAFEQRHLDANVVRLRAGKRIDTHTGPDLDVLMLAVEGSGEVVTDDAAVPLAAGALIWLPRRSRRSIVAGPDGLAYLTVHPRRPGLRIGGRPQ